MADVAAPWLNKIVGHGEEAPDQLLAHPLNFRAHGKDQQAAVAACLAEVGIIQSVIVNRRTQHVIDGHLRVALALSRGEKTIPVSYVDLDEATERKALALFDAVGAMAGVYQDQLGVLLAQVATDDAGLQAVLEALVKPATRTVEFEVPAEQQTCPTCGQKLKAGKALTAHAEVTPP